MNLDQVLQTFIVESRELLEEMERALLAADTDGMDAETVNAIFRAAHTIKGAAGLFDFEHVVSFTHVVESVLDSVRDGKIVMERELVALLLSCGDHIGVLIDAAKAGQPSADQATTLAGDVLLGRLRAHLQASPAATFLTALPVADDRPRPEASDALDGPAVSADTWHISLRFGREVLRNGLDPLSFIRYLRKLGTIVGMVTIPDAIPAEGMDPEVCYLGFEIALRSTSDKAAIENVFEFVRDDCRIRIMPPKSRISEYVRLIGELSETPKRLGEVLIGCGTLTAHELEAALAIQRDSTTTPPPPLGAILIDEGIVQPAVLDAALKKQQQARDSRAQESHSIRVDADKLDHLINLVGELIIAAASTDVISRRTRIADLQDCTATLSGLVEDVRDSALQLRMVKIGATFNRFQRVVHDVSRDLGKDIGLVVSGEDTELDKTVVERIGDPLTHLIRNAMDHGIEAPDVRSARGKPAKGTVRLNAYHDSGSIVIQVSDDGGGLERGRILAKAIERGMIEPGRVLSAPEIYGLIFEPGFSTAEQVTNLSGRGVGMDVVKRNITALRGTVGIDSQVGAGTTVTIRLPLTLAIINGFLVGLGQSVFVVPLDMIEECIEFTSVAGHDYTNLRGHALPFIRLRELFQVGGAPAARENIVVIRHAGQKTGLVVDELLGEFQTVIKPMDKMFTRARCISGSTILGSGQVALILDVPALVKQAGQTRPEQPEERRAIGLVTPIPIPPTASMKAQRQPCLHE
jgi:two-component system chemotaxis sensor kinase CheA